MSKIIIVGAGMAGLLAGCMLRSDCAEIIEKQDEIPNNHSALLRFRSSVVGDVLGIPFKKVQVLKTIAPWRNPLADALAYAKKCTGSYTLRSSLSAKSEMEQRFTAPDDFINMMSKRVQAPMKFGKALQFSHRVKEDGPVISTIPMPLLMDALGYNGERPHFPYIHGANINATIEGVNAYATLYVPNPDIPFNRISLTGDKLTVEFANTNSGLVSFDEKTQMTQAINMLGMRSKDTVIRDVSISDQKYAKILPIDDNVRKRFILWATEKHNVFSLGRFATWRPGLLLDDVVNDVRVIQNIISHGAYNQRK